MRDAIAEMGGKPERINPLQPVELVIDHSVQVDVYGTAGRLRAQRRARVRAQRRALRLPQVGTERAGRLSGPMPPDTGIVHQVNIEYLARIVFGAGGAGEAAATGTAPLAYPDSVVGTDSHTPMANGLGVLAWGVGGIEAEAAMLGQPVTMLIPEGDRLPPCRQAERRRHRHRPRSSDHADAAQEGRRRKVRRVLRPRRG